MNVVPRFARFEKIARAGGALGCAAVLTIACSSNRDASSTGSTGGHHEPTPHPTTLAMSFPRGSLYDAPFPSDDLIRTDGHVDVSLFENPKHVSLIDQTLALLKRDARGFALAGGVYFRASAPIDPASLPDTSASIGEHATVFLVGVDASRPDYRKRYPIDVAFRPDGGPFGDKNLLAALPIQGIPLRPATRYAAVVTTSVLDVHGEPLEQAAAVTALAAGKRPDGMTAAVADEYTKALDALAPLVGAKDIAALTVFTTDDPTAGVGAVIADALASHPVSAPKSPPTLKLNPDLTPEIFPDYCVYETTIDVPDYQSGTPAYDAVGGDWLFDDAGKPIFDHMETAGVVFTVPRATAPSGGWPTVVFVRTGAGGDTPLVDRGPCADPTYTTAIAPGTGPGLHFAKVGFAGVQFDGPFGGLRHTENGNEDFQMFNINNAAALRDNVRQSAMELAVYAHTLGSVSFDVSDCPGASSPATFDTSRLALMGHSMGSWVAPLALAWEPMFRAGVLSGAGGSYIANVLDKILPLHVRPLAEAILGYPAGTLEAHDPALMLVQWGAEPSDPQVYDRFVMREPLPGAAPRDVLMLQGIVDHYILPSIANATSLPLGLDEAGPAYDATNAEEASLGQTPLGKLLHFAGNSAIGLPATANATSNDGTKVTAVVVQHPSDGIEDGHEVVFQSDEPKHQYRCFLASFAAGAAGVPPDGAADAPCP